MHLYHTPQADPRCFNDPTWSEVADVFLSADSAPSFDKAYWRL